MSEPKKNTVTGALGWKLLERFGIQGVQFILQLVLARILDPEHYGTISLMVVFTTLANVFIQRGFNTALIQNKDVTEEDYSSVFWVTLSVATILYGVLFFCAPAIAAAYDMTDFVAPFRVLTLILFPGAINSIQLAKVSRELDFKKVFFSNVGGIIVAGIAGITIACMGGGVWALVFQTLLATTVPCIVMRFTVKWKIRMRCDIHRVKILFSYGWKLLVSGLIDTLYQDLRSLVIGLKYDSGTLGYYNRGKQFPQFLINSFNSTIQSVMLPAMAAQQDDKAKVKELMRNSIMLSSYIIFPMMAGLAGVAEPLIRLLLTDKWLPAVPFMQIYCFTFAFYPVHSCNLQAINAVGRSDIFLKLEIIKKSFGIAALLAALFLFDSPIAIALTGVVTAIVSSFVNAYPNKKLIGYAYLEQIKDILPSFAASGVMCVCVLAVGKLELSTIAQLILQIFVGVVIYVAISAVFRLKPFFQVLELVKGFLKRK